MQSTYKRYKLSIPKWPICEHGPAYTSLEKHAPECTSCLVLYQLALIYYNLQFRQQFDNVTRLEELVHVAPDAQDIANVMIPALQQKLETPGRTHIHISFWLPRTWDPKDVFKFFTEDLSAPVSLQWPWVQFSDWPGNTWFYSQHISIQQWLRDSCVKSRGDVYHQFPMPSARGAADPPHLPTRILDLTPIDLSPGILRGVWFDGRLHSHLDLRLVTPQEDSTGHYMTLSHRWGHSQTLRLTSKSLARFRRKISFRSLPKTYQDAVIVARTLGFRYLWIDTLCILQDDPVDWLEESSRMAAIYHNSCCTIAAHGASHDKDGFLDQERPRILRKRKATNFTEEVSNSTLSTRGWVFQERILSRRLLHFTQRNIFMEDASGVKVVCRGIKVPQIYNPWVDNKYNLEDSQANEGQWCTLIEKFTNCQLTFDTDRLPAIAGLAKLYGAVTKDENYIWGLWASKFHQGLLWTLDSDRPQRLVFDNQVLEKCPSWSWGGWSGGVRFPVHISTCVPVCTMVTDSENTSSVSETILDGRASDMLITVLTVEREDVIFKQTGYALGASSFGEGLKVAYTLDFPGFPWIAWMSLDGEQAQEVRYPKVTLALIARNEEKEVVMGDRNGSNVPVTRTRSLYYFLVLCDALGSQDRYQRVGIGAAWSKSAWENVQSRIITII